jgi:hypothetical protein
LNWDSGLGFKRWHLERYWANASYGLDTLATEQQLAFSRHQHAWAKALIDRGLDTYERWAAQSPRGMLPWTMFGIRCSIGSPDTDSQLIASRFAAHAARDALLGVGGIAAETPPAVFARDPEVQRLAVSTPRYATAITGAHSSARYGGLELARLYDADSYPVSGTGGAGRVAFGLAFASGGHTRLDTQPGSARPLAAAARLSTTADARRARRGTFRDRLIAGSRLANAYAAVSVTHVFTAGSVTVTHRVRARRSGTVTVRFPVYGDHSAIRARRIRGRLRALILTAQHGGYTVTFLQLPARARLRLITCACQPSAPHTRRVAQISFPVRERQARTVTVRLTPR